MSLKIKNATRSMCLEDLSMARHLFNTSSLCNQIIVYLGPSIENNKRFMKVQSA